MGCPIQHDSDGHGFGMTDIIGHERMEPGIAAQGRRGLGNAMCSLACVVAYASLGLAEVAGEVGTCQLSTSEEMGKCPGRGGPGSSSRLCMPARRGFGRAPIAARRQEEDARCRMHDFGSRLLIRVDQISGKLLPRYVLWSLTLCPVACTLQNSLISPRVRVL